MAFTTSRTTPVWALLTALSLWLPSQRSPDEFVETFELAAPGEELQVYSKSTFRRVKP